MSKLQVTMRESVFAAGGVAMLAGTVQTLQADEAAGLVQQNKATRYGTGWAEDPDSLTPAQIAAVGALVSGARIPPGVTWMPDSLGIDPYRYFIPTRAPTIYIDPTYGGVGNGSYYHPFTNDTDVNNRCQGDMSRDVVGLKRGTTLRTAKTYGLQFRAYGTRSDPLFIVPYGDAEALPIVTGGLVITSWAPYDTSDPAHTIWSFNVGATARDVWYAEERLADKAYSGSVAATLTADWLCTYTASTLYIKLPFGENPNLGQVEVAMSDYTFTLFHPNVAAGGWVTVAGLDVRKARNNAFVISGETGQQANITSLTGYVIACNSSGQAGTDFTSGLGSDAFSMYGAGVVDTVVRMTECLFTANYSHRSLNNALEVAGHNGTKAWFNSSYDCGGSGCEMWSDVANTDHAYGYYYRHSNIDRRTGSTRLQAFVADGAWLANNCFKTGVWSALAASGSVDQTHTKNVNNVSHHNIFAHMSSNFTTWYGGSGNKFQHNTCYWDPAIVGTADSPHTSPAQPWVTPALSTTLPAPGFVSIDNNLWVYASYSGSNSAQVKINGAFGSTACIPNGNNNIYLVPTGKSLSLAYPGAGFNPVFATWQTQLSAAGPNSAYVGAGMDQNSSASGTGTNGNSNNTPTAAATVASVAFDAATLAPGAGSIALLRGRTDLTGLGYRYQDGKPYVAATCTVGALLGG